MATVFIVPKDKENTLPPSYLIIDLLEMVFPSNA
jgi:hypothetical protein